MARQRISYVDPDTISDPKMKEELDRCRREGTPRPESSAIRAHVPAVFWSFANTWRDVFKNGILDHNIKTTYNVYEAARRQGVRRVVFASSNHAIGMYPRSQKIGPDVPVRPDTYYGVSKAFGEALGRLYSEKWGLEVACIRIGTVNAEDKPLTARHLSTWLSHRDAVGLIRACLDAPLNFQIVYGVSKTSRAWWDMRPAEALGYSPQDNADDYADEVGPDPSEPLGRQGGQFVAPDFTGDA